MNKEEILEYNIRCAEFLGYINITPTDKDFNIYHNEKGMTIRGTTITMIEIISAKFHSDWNWIMELVEAIGKIKRILISYTHCEIHMYEKDKISICIGRNLTKIAVVEAINQFLIWYKTKKP